MNILIALVIGAVVGFWLGKRKSSTTAPTTPPRRLGTPPQAGGDGVAGQQKDKAEGKAKILEMFSEERTEITNNDVEQALGVSDRSATRYLEELEQEGKIVQIGRTGRAVTYRLK